MVLKKFFSPDDFVEEYEFIDVEYMNMHNKKVIISDLDNTLISWDSKKNTKKLTKWLTKMRKAGFDIIVVSNNSEERVRDFCKKLNLEYVAEAKKPLTNGFKKALKKLNRKPEEAIILGDQVLTDIFGAKNLGGAMSVLVKPISRTDAFKTRINRYFESKIVTNLKEKKQFPVMKLRKNKIKKV
ncbi:MULTISPECIES: YqeG family HAD IIIA-type phosphatase [unclassified Gemella]|uniref:YqeG family HAD IIIA-type phosphatase n=1 Tax=unclassified Gemella TaxID=2624949 RepID=UPI001C056A9B|nr:MULTISPECIES: YqeG family HAD IIIA-type phosphatase [unclassified Gemella]MBU0278650.1 YqeG family HAD IIIA-type phosphatase [Gemella sp. zg-1178]QWQ39206.1 YqeG family HAD IIIA-type phosphatase [Gemella sp. zg-570]